jgi:hypothetical protein
VTERRSGSSFSDGRKPERLSGTFFPPAIDITGLGVSCYPTGLLSNKLAQHPLKFQRATANNSLDFVQFLNPPPTEFWVTMRSGTYFIFLKIALVISQHSHGLKEENRNATKKSKLGKPVNRRRYGLI